MLNPCVRESKARTGRFLREQLISDDGLIFPYEGEQETANGEYSWGFFRDAQGLDGWTLARAPASPA